LAGTIVSNDNNDTINAPKTGSFLYYHFTMPIETIRLNNSDTD